jgi:glycosyltransferase involved in cell wall biosynthesis
MKIIHLTSYYMEGLGYQENWLPSNQRELGHDIVVLTSDRWFPLPNYDVNILPIHGARVNRENIREHGVYVHRLPTLIEIKSRALIYFRTRNFIARYKPDVIHLHGATNFFFFPAVIYSLVSGCKLFIDCHQDELVTRHSSIWNRLYYMSWKAIYHFLQSSINGFLPISEASENFLVEKIGIEKKRCLISPLGYSPEDKFYSETLALRFRQKHGLTGYQIFVNAGKQYPDKEIIFILDTYEEMLGRCEGAKLALVLVGESIGEYEKEIKSRISQVNLSNQNSKIIRIPFVENAKLNEIYSAADIGVWPGVASNTIQEAMACGVVVALLDSQVTNHLMVDEVLKIRELDPISVSEQLISVVKNKQVISRLRQETRSRIQNYSWEKIALDSLAIYEKL